ncbi:helix-turn-helix transcriptional regulator [Leucobacter denitrificans]|uniref:LuxR family transcriptional regulator n=1 Tax=Leucobacter denitrificans TaxID=683042 RepID=A0A7G9S7C1_9MICO|nr:LuxR family transcriptional regulator [Leucobacter denitrificans]QNN63746.1 LuxR family transcriptional regulator [Leucobacter denitrificans]
MLTPQTALSDFVVEIERTFTQGDAARTVELIERHPLESWFGLRPERFHEILESLTRDGANESPFLRVLAATLLTTNPATVADQLGGEHSSAAEEPADAQVTPVDVLVVIGQLFKYRLEGRPVAALEAGKAIDTHASVMTPIFDRTRGWSLFAAVQLGLTAMLAGDFNQALMRFKQARMSARSSALAFLARDACAKAAVIEAVYGDTERARTLLEEADGIARTESWAEPTIDAAYAIAAAMVRLSEPKEAVRMLEAIPLGDIGEIWPFYVAALHRAYAVAGNPQDSARRVAKFEHLPLPAREGEGFTGSVMLLCSAATKISVGDGVAARDAIAKADQNLLLTKLVTAILELQVGRPKEALRITAELSEHTRDLRQLQVWRLSVIAGSYFLLGSIDECRDVFEFALDLPGGLRPDEAAIFPVQLRELAEEMFEQWPRGAEVDVTSVELYVLQQQVLSERELEVLRSLAAGYTREEIAKSHFISMNTLKAHLRAIYRKLGAGSRAAAVLEAERRGLI